MTIDTVYPGNYAKQIISTRSRENFSVNHRYGIEGSRSSGVCASSAAFSDIESLGISTSRGYNPVPR